MRPWPVDRLDLADDALFKVKPPLAPAEDFRDCSFAFKTIEDGVADGALLEINFAVAAAGFKGETAATLTEATHLEDFSRRKLIQIADEGVTGIVSLRRCP